jgi:hypothetical protein
MSQGVKNQKVYLNYVNIYFPVAIFFYSIKIFFVFIEFVCSDTSGSGLK